MQPLAVLLVAAVIIAALALASSGSASDDANPSSRSAGKLGTLALYTWLGRLGLDVSRITGSFSLVQADVLIEYDPTVAFTANDLDALEAFLQAGGEMVLAWDGGTIEAAAPVLQRLQVLLGATEGSGTAVAAQPFDPSGRLVGVPVGPGFALSEQRTLAPLLRENGQVVAGAIATRSGRAFLIGNSLPLSNDGLRHDDSPYLVLSILERARGGRVAFDEFHHGEGGSSGGAGAIFDGPVGLAALLAVVLCVVALGVNGRRLGRSVATGDATAVPSTTSYVTAVGDLFARSRRRGMIAGRYGDELKRRVSDVTGISPHLDDASFVAALRAAGDARASRIAELLARARSLALANPDERTLLDLARDIDSAEHEWPATAQLRP